MSIRTGISKNQHPHDFCLNNIKLTCRPGREFFYFFTIIQIQFIGQYDFFALSSENTRDKMLFNVSIQHDQ